MRKKSFWTAILVLCAFVVISLNLLWGRGRTTCPRAFHESIDKVYVFDEHSECLPVWAEEGADKEILVHIDAHHDMLRDKGKTHYEPLIDLLNQDDYEKLLLAGRNANPDALYSLSNYVVPSYYLGLIQEIWWVYPLNKSINAGFFQKLKDFLLKKQFGRFSPEEIDGFELKGKHISGSLHGIPLKITSLVDLPEFKESVLLDVDCDYFVGDYSAEIPFGDNEQSMGMRLRQFRGMVKGKNLKVKVATVAYSLAGEYLPMNYMYIGQILEKWLRNPEERDVWNNRDWDLLRKGEQALKTGNLSSAKGYFLQIDSGRTIISPYSKLYLAVIEAESGNYRESMNSLAELATMDPLFIRAFKFVGSLLEQAEKPGYAIPYYEKLKDYGKTWEAEGWAQKGKIYFNAGDYEKAKDCYTRLVELNPEADIGTSYLADTHFILGDDQKAYDLYKKIWNPDDPGLQQMNRNFLPNFIRASLAMGDRHLASELLQVLRRIDPDNFHIDELKGLRQ